MPKKTKLIKISIILGMLLILLVTFMLFIEFFDAANAPFIPEDDNIVLHIEVIDIIEVSDIPELSLPFDTSGPDEIVSDVPPADDLVTVRMDPADIHRGSLLLINQRYAYEIPEDHEFVSVAENKTASYMISEDDILICKSVIGPLNDMMDAFYANTVVDAVAVISGQRGYEKQQEILDEYIERLGEREAVRWAARPGHSEHHTGLAVDFGIYSNRTLRTFLGTGTSAWFKENSYKYGFILRFPQDKERLTGTPHEPWHFRYVGEVHAYFMHQNNWCLEEYLRMLGRCTLDAPFTAVFNDVFYEIFYAGETDILIPLDCDFDISGNNIDGFIVTIVRTK